MFYVIMSFQTYSREHLLRLRNDMLKVNQQTHKQLIANRIWKPRHQLRNTTGSAGENWSIVCAGEDAPIDNENPQNSVQKPKWSKKTKLLCPKQIVSIGTWNIRTVREHSQLHILAKELDNWKCDILGISETYRRGTEELCINGYKFIAQGVEDGTSRSGVGMLLSKNVQKALVGYNQVSDRILLVRFNSFVRYVVVI